MGNDAPAHGTHPMQARALGHQPTHARAPGRARGHSRGACCHCHHRQLWLRRLLLLGPPARGEPPGPIHHRAHAVGQAAPQGLGAAQGPARQPAQPAVAVVLSGGRHRLLLLLLLLLPHVSFQGH